MRLTQAWLSKYRRFWRSVDPRKMLNAVTRTLLRWIRSSWDRGCISCHRTIRVRNTKTTFRAMTWPWTKGKRITSIISMSESRLNCLVPVITFKCSTKRLSPHLMNIMLWLKNIRMINGFLLAELSLIILQLWIQWMRSRTYMIKLSSKFRRLNGRDQTLVNLTHRSSFHRWEKI